MSIRPLPCFLLAGLAAACSTPERIPMKTVQHMNPEGLQRNPAFTHVVSVHGPHTTVYVGGQNAVDGDGNIVGRGDVGAQAAQVARNLQTALKAAGTDVQHVVKWNVYTLAGQPVRPAIAAFNEVLGPLPNPPVISVLFVAGLAHPEFLLEIDAIAVVPDEE